MAVLGIKRVRASMASRRPFKRRRLFRRRFRRGGRKAISFTSQATRGSTVNFRARKLKRRAYKRALWRDTLFKTHFRSAGNGVTTIQTGAVTSDGSINIADPFFIGTPSDATAFWTTAGGLQPIDFGDPDPTFGRGSFVIRGGTIGVTANMQATIPDTVNLKVFTIFTTSRPDFSKIGSLLAYGTRLDTGPEFTQQVGRVVDMKEVTLGPDNPSFTLIRRLGVQKVDREIFGTSFGSHHLFVVVPTNLSDTTDVALTLTTFHDLSFTGDIIT